MKDRLNTIADMVPSGCRIADIGTDHGFLPIELVRSGKCPSAIAMDIVGGPLDRARAHISEAGLSDKIECRLSDGFDRLSDGEADAAVIAGMGGDIMAEIIARKPDAAKELILSPHTHPEKVRIILRRNHFRIVEERMIQDENKYYVFIRAVKDEEAKDLDVEVPINDYFGPSLLKKKDETLKQYLLMEVAKFKHIEQKRDYVRLVEEALSAIG